MLVGLDPTALLERAEVDRDAAPRDVELPRDVGDARPTAVFRSHGVDREEMVGGAVRQLVRFEFLPGLHVAISIWYVCLTCQTHGVTAPPRKKKPASCWNTGGLIERGPERPISRAERLMRPTSALEAASDVGATTGGPCAPLPSCSLST